MKGLRPLLTLLALLLLTFFLLETAALIPFGAPARTAMDDHFLRYTQEETGANNAVTAIVFDYRGFDTLGEATVLFTAVLGVGLVLRQRRKKQVDDE